MSPDPGENYYLLSIAFNCSLSFSSSWLAAFFFRKGLALLFRMSLSLQSPCLRVSGAAMTDVDHYKLYSTDLIVNFKEDICFIL